MNMDVVEGESVQPSASNISSRSLAHWRINPDSEPCAAAAARRALRVRGLMALSRQGALQRLDGLGPVQQPPMRRRRHNHVFEPRVGDGRCRPQ
jgi:hypothetical protein